MNASNEMPVQLHRKTDFDQYERQLVLSTLPDWPSTSWNVFRVEVESVLAQGGDLWEWEYLSDLGLTGITGLAVVRDGAIIRKWQLWKA